MTEVSEHTTYPEFSNKVFIFQLSSELGSSPQQLHCQVHECYTGEDAQQCELVLEGDIVIDDLLLRKLSKGDKISQGLSQEWDSQLATRLQNDIMLDFQLLNPGEIRCIGQTSVYVLVKKKKKKEKKTEDDTT
eukprot:TRINITY_DN24101_c0_g1_i1.p1 TRINITY_DN24101_c0_g1~~TRINITY_DN24101_c0_g1_i1.p1  ORF type:complete len:133 (-),score=12.23 TRINITY_DN24101_c0_g1_i1:1-399(-)